MSAKTPSCAPVNGHMRGRGRAGRPLLGLLPRSLRDDLSEGVEDEPVEAPRQRTVRPGVVAQEKEVRAPLLGAVRERVSALFDEALERDQVVRAVAAVGCGRL